MRTGNLLKTLLEWLMPIPKSQKNEEVIKEFANKVIERMGEEKGKEWLVSRGFHGYI